MLSLRSRLGFCGGIDYQDHQAEEQLDQCHGQGVDRRCAAPPGSLMSVARPLVGPLPTTVGASPDDLHLGPGSKHFRLAIHVRLGQIERACNPRNRQ